VRKYFTGRNVGSKKLVASTATNFQDFVAHYLNLPVLLPVGREEFHALPKLQRDEIKRGAGYFVACTFPASPWEGRLLENAGVCNLVILDIDPLPDGSCPAAPFVDNPELLKERLREFNFAAYKTISHTPESPRLRILVDADAISPEKYPDAVLTVAQMIGLSHVTRESIIAVQAMFRPCVFSDQDAETDHPLTITWADGGRFTEGRIAKDITDLPGVISTSGSKQRKQARTGDVIDDFLTYFSRPVDGITIDTVKEAMGFLEPDCGYHEWLEIAAALKHQFGSTDNEQAAYDLFDEWSAKGTKYAGQKDTTTKWKSLTEQPAGRAPITIRSLLKRAAAGGWDSAEMKDSCFGSVSNWIQFECKSSSKLMSEGPKRIAATPLLSSTEEDALVQVLVATLRQKFEQRLTPASVRREIRAHREGLFVKDAVEKEKVVPPWGRGIVYVSSIHSMFRPHTRQQWKLHEFDAVYGRKLLPSLEELQKNDTTVTQAALHTPMFKPSDYLLYHLECQTVDEFDYDPTNPEDIIVRRDGKLYVNLYRRSYKKADKSKASYALETFEEHICNLIREPEYRTHIMDWMAYNVQNPGAKIRWAPLIQGAEGCGKTFLAVCMQAMLGADNVMIVNKEAINKGWTEWMFGRQVVAFEEIRVSGHNRHDVMNTLKEPITNDTISINQRGRDTRNIRNVTNYIAFTNHHDALVLTDDSRRYCVVKSPLQTLEAIKAITGPDPGYFARIFDMLATHAAGLRYVFENRIITSGFPANGPAPRTKYLVEMVADTTNELLAAIHKIIEDNDNPYVQKDIICTSTLISALEQEGLRGIYPQAVGKQLREAGFTKINGKFSVGSGRQYIWYKPDLIKSEEVLTTLEARIKEATSESWD